MAEQKSQAVRTVPAGDIKAPWEVREMPAPPPMTMRGLMTWAGPAVILGALSVGGFEAYQAGYVAANKWTGIYWLYVVSCFFQLLMNNEIARYTIATGETTLQGFTRLKPAKFWSWVTAIFCVLQQGWPAWIGGAAAGVAALFGIPTWQYVGMVALGLVFFVFAGSKRVYNTLEYIMYAAFVIATAGLGFLTVFMTNWECVGVVTKGWLGLDTMIPVGITLTAVGPFLNQPAGGFWNFWHTYWVREKGMGMAKYFGHVTGLTAPAEEVRRTGFIFDADDPGEVEKFRAWLKMNTVSLAIFFIILGGILFTYFASLAGYSAAVIYKMQVPSGIKIATILAEIFKSAFGQFGFVLFCIVLIFALFDSQFSVYDGIARMFADTVIVETEALGRPYRFWYFLMLGILCGVGMITVWMKTPYLLWVIINWAGVAVHASLTLGIVYLNWKLLPLPIKPARWIIVLNVVWAVTLFIYFAAWTIYDNPLGLKL